jgi:hypothetical protein
MALFCQNMVELSLELVAHDPTYEDLTNKFVEHFLWIAAAVNRLGADSMSGRDAALLPGESRA